MYDRQYHVYARYSMMTKMMHRNCTCDMPRSDPLICYPGMYGHGGLTSILMTKAPTNTRPMVAKNTMVATTRTGLNICQNVNY
jgi:hypothetical protein